MAYLTAREIVLSRGVSRRTLLRMVEHGEISYVQKLSAHTGAYLFDPAEVERAFAARDERRANGEQVPA